MQIKIPQAILVTCALPYVNNVPHVGNIAGSHLPADIFARFCRLAGYETVFVGGSDDHGTPSEVAAEKLGISPKELCEKYYEVHKKIYDWLDISYDNFSRTSIELHHETTREFFTKIYEKGYVSEGTLKLPYCGKCRRMLPDRYVEGTCPKCGYEAARGDQCESCSSLLNPDELKRPYCVICRSTPQIKEVKHLFLKLDKLEPQLEKWIKSKKDWSGHVTKMALGWINEGLKPRCITRDIKWGVKVQLKGYEDKVFYVWFDAPIGYISSTKEWANKVKKPEAWKKFWKSKDAKIFHFIGKDNIPFHTIFWPGMLIANGEYELPYRVAGLQYLNFEGGKISKSRSWGIFCENLPDAGIDSEIWRYYLTLLIPETSDTEWKWKEFKERVNNELIANFGNFLYRTLSFIQSNFDGRVPEAELKKRDKEMLEVSRKHAAELQELLGQDLRIRDAMRKVLELSDRGNKYFQKNEPWKIVKEDRERAAATLYTCANLCCYLAILISPFLPKSAQRICQQLNAELGNLEDVGKEKIKAGQKLGKIEPLFQKLDDRKIERVKRITSKAVQPEELFEKRITSEEFSKFEFKTAKVLSAERIKNTDKLLKVVVEVGKTKKQVVAGIARYYRKEELVGKTAIVIDNLRQAEIMGEKSEGMLLAAGDGKKFVLVTTDREVGSGSRVRG